MLFVGGDRKTLRFTGVLPLSRTGRCAVDLATILLIAVSLAMDSFAVSIAHGMTIKNRRVATGLGMAFSFGLFQALMPVLGWLAGLTLIDLIANFDHWLAFGLLAFIGGKMIYSARNEPEEEKEAKLTVLLILSVATSIDALAVGLSFSLLQVSITTPVIAIGVVAFLLSFAGFNFGNKLGKFFERKVQVIGGIVLIAIGIKILLEHLLT